MVSAYLKRYIHVVIIYTWSQTLGTVHILSTINNKIVFQVAFSAPTTRAALCRVLLLHLIGAFLHLGMSRLAGAGLVIFL